MCRQRDVDASGVLSRQTPLGFTVTHNEYLLCWHNHGDSYDSCSMVPFTVRRAVKIISIRVTSRVLTKVPEAHGIRGAVSFSAHFPSCLDGSCRSDTMNPCVSQRC